jgi:hypothetical protein
MSEIFEDDAEKSKLLRRQALRDPEWPTRAPEREPLALSDFAVTVVVAAGFLGLGVILGSIAARFF